MTANCQACALGPTKVDGHAELMVHSLAAAGMLFKCSRCELPWMRSYSPDGRYEWMRLSDRIDATACVGIVMPSSRPPPAAVAALAGAGGDAVDHWLAIQRSWKRSPRVPR